MPFGTAANYVQLNWLVEFKLAHNVFKGHNV